MPGYKLISLGSAGARLIAPALLILFSGIIEAGDWPQILGPNRNGVAIDEQIVDSFPALGPPVLWESRLGEGFSGVAVAEGVAVVFHRQQNSEIAEGLESTTGKQLWKKEFPATYSGGYSSDHGPRCVPVIHN